MPSRLTTSSRLGPRAVIAAVIVVAAITGCASLPRDVARTPSFALADSAGTQLARQFADDASAHPGSSGVLLLGNGLDAYVARAVLARRAERTIDAQYYLYHDDVTGRLFTRELLDAAGRGVRVRLLVDDIDFGGREFGAAVLSLHPNMEVRLFNPFARGSPRAVQFATRFGRITRRMHNKSFIVDGTVAVVGGRNIGDEYFDADPALNFTDLDALVVGPVVREASASFDAFWNHELAYPAETLNRRALDPHAMDALRERFTERPESKASARFIDALTDSALADRLRGGEPDLEWVDVRLVSDSPEKIEQPRGETAYHLAPELGALFSSARDELVIISPYFVPGRAGVEFLGDMVERGVRVRVLTNSLASTDVPVVHAGYARYRRALLRAGVEIHEARSVEGSGGLTSDPSGSSAASLHAKSFVVDRRRVFIGSLNLDPRSVRENTEMGLVIESPAIAGDMMAWFETFVAETAYKVDLETSRMGIDRLVWTAGGADGPRTWHREPEASLPRRLAVAVVRLLPIESQL